ncbi:MAG: MATE family efflux transporter [Lachnospiraceae bacterium]|nr:MATE family efflux transporter [Lachnospiraceae bacterium]
MTKDLTIGKPNRVLWQFCLPLFGSVIFQQMYNIADSLIAGQLIGENALAAIGNSYEITLIFIAFAFGCNIGCSVIVSQLFGAKKLNAMKTAVYTAFIASAFLCVLLMLFGIILGEKMLLLIQTPDVIMDDSRLYLDIYVWGFPFLLFYNIATGIFSGIGDSKTPFYFLAFSSVTNIIVDIWFVKGFGMGVAGVAWATFLCQGISCILSMFVVLRRLNRFESKEKVDIFSWDLLRKIAAIAIPSIFQQSFISIGNIMIQGVINGFGPGVIAGYAASVKLNNLVIASLTTLGNGISNFTAQNIGAGKLPRVKEGFRVGIKMVWMLCVPFILLYVVFGRQLMNLFLSEPSIDALNTGITFLRILAPFYLIISVKLATDGILRGAGMMKQFMVATFSDLILRVLLAVVLSGYLGSVGIWCAWPIGWAIGTVLSLRFYRGGLWNKK